MRLGLFSLLENHLYFSVANLFMIFAHFSIKLLMIFLLIHKSLSHTEEMDQ